MHAFRTGILATALALASTQAASASTLAEDVTGSLNTMKSVYRTEYAPAAWKKQYASYDLDTEYNRAIAAVQANPNLTVKDSRTIFKNFIYAMKDYHTSIQFVSTEAASLPFSVKGTGDHYYLVYINRDKLSESSFPFHVGDELVTMDGVPTSQAVAAVQAEIPANVPATDQALAEMYLTNRSATRGYNVPQGPITLGIRPQGSTQVTQMQLIWNYTPEQIRPRQDLNAFALADMASSSIFHPKMDVPHENLDNENPYGLGSRKTFTPDLGSKISETGDDNTFYSYIYRTPDRKLIGYVRIPSYVPDDYDKALADFAKIIKSFQASTDAMIIDQVNNPGGSVNYLYGLAAMLTDHPLRTPLHRMAITQAEVAEALARIPVLQQVKNDDDAAKALKNDLDGYPASYEFAQFTLNYAKFFVSEWNAGHKLTTPYWIGGIDHINPAPVHYTKPILILTNHLDFSGGDFFPTILQDNQRVTILGSRTAGAGGYVNDVGVPNDVGILKFRVTESIAERVSGNPIENLGVTPDIVYEMTDADFTQNYTPYVALVQATISSMAK